MMGFNIVEEIFKRHHSDAVAVIDQGQHHTFAALKASVEAQAAALPDLAQKRVGLFLPNGIAHILWSLAILKRGGVLVPVPTELAPEERLKLLETTRLHYVLSPKTSPWLGDGSSCVELGEGQDHAAILAIREWRELDFEKEFQALNPALIRFSSGTTADSKGVVLSHETLLARVETCNQGLQIGPGDRVIWTLPMAHHFAVSIVLYLLHGATTVIENAHLGESLFEALQQHQGTVLYGSPFHFALLGACAKAKPVASLRLAVSTASPLKLETAQAYYERFGIPLTQGLGVIELGLPILNSTDASAHPESIGKPQRGFKVKIVDRQDQAVPVGEIGNLYIQGPGMFDAYLHPWRTRSSVVDGEGYFATGDLVRVDAGDLIRWVGRSKSVINVGGMKCFPEEIESVLLEHPDILEARVRAEEHSTFGNVPAAELVLKNSETPPKLAALMNFCRSRLASYKIPLKYQFVSSIPKTPSGKILRH